MNGVHDMGGMHGFGPVRPENHEPLFHAPWESRVLAITLAMAGWRKWNLDASRYARERIPPADYLRMSYYERWAAGLCRLMTETGLVDATELESSQPAPGSVPRDPPVKPEMVPGILDTGASTERAVAMPPRFAIGQRVRTRNIHPTGHTRLPRYARGKIGTVTRLHGGHVFADAHARGLGECPQHLYNLRFGAEELWGRDAAFRGAVHLDLWEDYLEHA